MIDGRKLKALREAANLTQVELAQRVGVTHAVIVRAENSTKDLSLGVAAAVAKVLGCRIDDFIRQDGGDAE